MDIGVFDHVDRSGAPLRQFYEDRLATVEAYDRIGIRGYHIAEHHFTPLGMAASPGVFLSAVAQRTKRLRFGPMVFCLPLYHPLRLAEEICMLDQMSGGRFELGVGRGISPLESRGYGENPDYAISQKVFTESLDILQKAMAGGTFSHDGEHRHVDNVAMVLEPFQKPHPPLWMGVHSMENVEFAARHGMNIISLHASTAIRDKFDHYRDVWREAQGAARPVGKAGLGLFVVVGETDAAARATATRAYKVWHDNFHYLYHLHGRAPVWGERPNDFQLVVDELRGVAGSPETVRAFIKARMAEANSDYLVCQFVFGDMTRAESLASIDLFGQEVMPALNAAPAMAAAI
jgi:alkanesulfonate monooxygenase SsuD/methylene tetrahydromethanopterin reductase-like flavin-dependent oxidoreductase (luciferase family)